METQTLEALIRNTVQSAIASMPVIQFNPWMKVKDAAKYLSINQDVLYKTINSARNNESGFELLMKGIVWTDERHIKVNVTRYQRWVQYKDEPDFYSYLQKWRKSDLKG